MKTGKMTYTGTILQDLQNIVDDCMKWNRCVCANCRQPYRDHSPNGAYCPDSSSRLRYLKTTFVAQRAEAKVIRCA